jgi:transcriptional regulator with XRE-family HTH domain
LAGLVREFRLARGMTQEELAASIGASLRWVAKFEAGSTTAWLSLALAAAEAVGLVVDVSPAPRSGDADETFRRVLGDG